MNSHKLNDIKTIEFTQNGIFINEDNNVDFIGYTDVNGLAFSKSDDSSTNSLTIYFIGHEPMHYYKVHNINTIYTELCKRWKKFKTRDNHEDLLKIDNKMANIIKLLEAQVYAPGGLEYKKAEERFNENTLQK